MRCPCGSLIATTQRGAASLTAPLWLWSASTRRSSTPSQIGKARRLSRPPPSFTLSRGCTPRRGGARAPYLNYILDRTGVSWLDGAMQIFYGNESASFRTLWTAIVRRCEGEKVCLSHADCRPGNMLWQSTAPSDPRDLFTMCDWEAASITPYLWDVTYTMISRDCLWTFVVRIKPA